MGCRSGCPADMRICVPGGMRIFLAVALGNVVLASLLLLFVARQGDGGLLATLGHPRPTPHPHARHSMSMEIVTTVIKPESRWDPNSKKSKERNREGLWIGRVADLKHVHLTVHVATELAKVRSFEHAAPAEVPTDHPAVDLLPIANPKRAQECPGIFSYVPAEHSFACTMQSILCAQNTPNENARSQCELRACRDC